MKKITTSIFLLLFSFGYAQYMAIPDSNFETELIDQGIDSEGVLDGQVLTVDITSVETLSINGSLKPNALKINDLTGIEDFTALKTLLCSNNLITSINLSSNLNLENLECYSNNIANLDISSNTALNLLHCNNNNLTLLDVSNNTQLSNLRCQSNQITTLDVTNSISLTELRCNNNNLQLNLDLSQNPVLTTCTMATNPDLLCVQVANAEDADAGVGIYASWTHDTTITFSENCSALSIDGFMSIDATTKVFPIPANKTLYISIPTTTSIKQITIYNLQGKSVHHTDNYTDQGINVEQLTSGIYVLNIKTKNTVINKKIIII